MSAVGVEIKVHRNKRNTVGNIPTIHTMAISMSLMTLKEAGVTLALQMWKILANKAL
jgi:hypothetical protein